MHTYVCMYIYISIHTSPPLVCVSDFRAAPLSLPAGIAASSPSPALYIYLYLYTYRYIYIERERDSLIAR